MSTGEAAASIQTQAKPVRVDHGAKGAHAEPKLGGGLAVADGGGGGARGHVTPSQSSFFSCSPHQSL